MGLASCCTVAAAAAVAVLVGMNPDREDIADFVGLLGIDSADREDHTGFGPHIESEVDMGSAVQNRTDSAGC